MIDSNVLGQVAARLMETLEADHPDARLVDAMVIVELDLDEDSSAARWACSSDRHIVRLGLVQDVAGYLSTPTGT